MFILSVNALRNCYESNSGKRQPLDQFFRIASISGEAAGIIDQKHVKGSSSLRNCLEQSDVQVYE